jgi:hypothetical protein
MLYAIIQTMERGKASNYENITKIETLAQRMDNLRESQKPKRRRSERLTTAGIMLFGSGATTYLMADSFKRIILDANTYDLIHRGALVGGLLGVMSLLIGMKESMNLDVERITTESNFIIEAVNQTLNGNIIKGTATKVKTDSAR